MFVVVYTNSEEKLRFFPLIYIITSLSVNIFCNRYYYGTKMKNKIFLVTEHLK